MQRRVLLSLLTSTAAVAVLPGCGFALRQAPNFAFSTLYTNMPEASPLAVELRRNLQSTGKVRVITDAAQINEAQVVLESLGAQREKVVLSVNASGQVREFKLRLRVRFRLRTQAGKELIPASEILLERDISFNESAVAAKDAEELLLYRDMQSDVVQQILRRLAAVQSL